MTNSSPGSSKAQDQVNDATEPTTEPEPASALSECNPRSLDEFFNRDPLDLTKQDRTVIVTELRRQRKAWAIAEAQGKTRMPKAPKAKAGAFPDVLKSIDELFDTPPATLGSLDEILE